MFLFGKKALISEVAATVLTHMNEAVIVADEHQQVVFFNAAAGKMFGYAEESILGERLEILLPERLHVPLMGLVDEFGDGPNALRRPGMRTRHIHARRQDGTEFAAHLSLFAAPSGRNRYLTAIIRDENETRKSDEELLFIAATDPLTGVYNRREFSVMAEREALRASRYGRPLSVMMLDIDHFKKMNDTYGHGAGDKALQRFSAICSNALRNVDIFGRWGGDEFVALLPETDIDGAAVIGERLRRLASDSVLNFEEHKIKMTISIGIAQFRNGEITVDAPVERADAMVYEAKRAGRDQISLQRN